MKIDKFRFNTFYRFNSEAKVTAIKDTDNTKSKNKLKKRIEKLKNKTMSEINQQYWDYILEIINNANDFSPEEKSATVSDIAEYYYTQTGYQMPSQMLYALADFLLDDTLSDRNIDKVAKTEYPILSFRQIKTRSIREACMEYDILDLYHSNIAQKKNTHEISLNR